MDIFVEFCLERFQKTQSEVIQLVGSPVLPADFVVGQEYMLFDVYTDRESSDSIPVQVLCEPERRVKKVVLEASTHHHYSRQLRFTTFSGNIDIFQCNFEGEEPNYMLYRFVVV